MSAFRNYVLRLVQATGDKFSTFQHTSLVDGDTLNTEKVALKWAPMRPVKIANQVTALGDYPSIGSVTIASGSGTSITLSGALPAGAGSAVGLLLIIMGSAANSANRWQTFKVIGHSGNVLTLNRALPAALTAGDPYDLIVDCEDFNLMVIKPEFSASTTAADIIPGFCVGTRTPDEPTPTARSPIRINDRIVTLENQGFQGDTEESSYWHGAAVSLACIGALGGKVRLHSISGGNVSLWAATA